jgi:hypothetical protein
MLLSSCLFAGADPVHRNQDAIELTSYFVGLLVLIQGVSIVALQLDMLEQFLFPQFGEDDPEGCMQFQQDGAPVITKETSASASTSVSQVGGLVERGRYRGHLVPPILLHWIFSCGVLSKTECTCHPYLQMSHSSCRSDARDATSRLGRN